MKHTLYVQCTSSVRLTVSETIKQKGSKHTPSNLYIQHFTVDFQTDVKIIQQSTTVFLMHAKHTKVF